MADDPNRVVVQLIGDTSSLDTKIPQAAATFSGSMTKIEASATQAESVIRSTHGAIATSSGNAASAQLILQSVVRRTTDQIAAGAPVATIFAEHVAGLAEAASLAGGSFGKFGEILAGPWGLALTAGVSVAAILAQKLYESSDATKEHTRSTKDLADAITELNKVTGVMNRTHEQEVAQNLAAARAEAASTAATRDKTKALLEQAIAQEKVSIGGLGGGSGGANLPTVNAQNRVSDLQQQLAAATAAADATQKRLDAGFRGAVADSVSNRVADETDKAAAANRVYENSLARLKAQFADGKLSAGEYVVQLRAIRDAHDEATAKSEKHRTSTRGLSEEAREAAKAERELNAAYAEIVGSLDPALDAANKYSDVLAKIDQQVRAGKFTPAQATSYRATALGDYLDADEAASNAALEKHRKEVLGSRQYEPRRVCRRRWVVSHAAISRLSAAA